MQAITASYPPLGQVTKVATPDVEFTSILDVDTKHANEGWQVLVRFASIGSDAWKENNLELSRESLFKPQGHRDAGRAELLFKIKIQVAAAIRFQLKFRRGPEESWVAAESNSSLDSIVLLTPTIHSPEKSLHVSDYIRDLNPDLRPRLLDNGSESGIISWLVEAPVDSAEGENPHMTQVMFGSPFGGDFLRWFAVSRNTTSWMAPRHGQAYFKLDVAAILCSFINSQGEHLIVIGISGLENVMTIFGDNNEGSLMIKMRNDRGAPGFGRVVVAIGTEFETTLANALGQARTLFGPTEGPKRPLDIKSNIGADQSWADQWVNGLIYSPKINGEGQGPSANKVMETLSHLAAKSIPISGLMLDDFWQKVDQNKPSQYHAGLVDFEADPVAFKSGLKQSIADIKAKHTSIKNVTVKCPMFGHWGGISEQAEHIRKSYDVVPVRRSEAIQSGPKTELTLSLVSAGDVERFFNEYYQFLSSCGVSAVYADGFYMIESLVSAIDRCSLAESYLDAESAAALWNFPGCTWTSMSLSPNALFNSLKHSQLRTQVVRNSGIFPDHREYVFNNASNALLSGSIGNIPDWGPVQSTKDNGGFHVAARAISGGPIQITSFDDSDAADLELVNQISGRTAIGKTVALRPTGIGRALNPYVGFKDNVLLKIKNTHDIGTSSISLFGIFNSSSQDILELVQINDFLGIDPDTEYILRSSSGLVSGHLRANSPSLLSVYLEVSSYEVVSAYPLTSFSGPQDKQVLRVATLGLQGKILGAAAIIDSAWSIEDDGLSVKTVLKALGVIEFYISDLPRRTIDDETCKIQLQGKPFAPSSLPVQVRERVLTLDLKSIWDKEMIESSTDDIHVGLTLS